MRVAIVGSRDFPRLGLVDAAVERLSELAHWVDGGITVVSGGARGVDARARVAASICHLPFEEMPADWSLGRRAGYLRNEAMISSVDEVIAFWDGESRGTKHSIDLALKLKKSLKVSFP